MADISKTPAQKLGLTIDRSALRKVLSNLSRSHQEAEWRVACGAGAASAKLDYPSELVNIAGKQLLDVEALRQFTASIKEVAEEQAWCVACGAGAAASPIGQLIDQRTSPTR